MTAGSKHEDQAGERGVVLHGAGGTWTVRTTAGDTREATLRGRLKQEGKAMKLAVGDDVVVQADARGVQWSITEIVPRRSVLARREPGGRVGERVVAANVDQVVVVFAAANPEPHHRMIDRFLVIAEANELAAVLVINKIDLTPDLDLEARWADYSAAGYPVHFTSTKTSAGLAALLSTLSGRTSALTGPSGAGKSSLLNTLYPGLNLRVGVTSPAVNKGRHTTVGALLHPLPDGGYVVDTPGLREVGVWGLAPADLDRCFPEFRPYLGHCRFKDCTHSVEPGCALRVAVAAGAVSRARFESFRKLYDEL
jgi:ribosome biogenesis GTPase / thiamine phosphate phosphatase